jgi:molecular chaperone DnaK
VDVLKKALESGDIEQIKAKSEELKQVAHKLAEEIYKNTEANGAAGSETGSEGPAAGAAGATPGAEDAQSANGSVEDIDYEVIDDEDSDK